MSLTRIPQDFQEPAPRRRAFSVRPRLVDLGISLAVCVLIVSLGSMIRSHLPPWPQALSPEQTPPWFYLIFTVPISIFITVAVHEAGHVVAALCMRYRLIMVAIGMVGFANEAGRLRLRAVGINPVILRGSTFVLTDIARGHRWRELVVLAGGPLAQALFLWGALTWGGAFGEAWVNPWFNALLYGTVLLTLSGLCSSAIPLQIGLTATDAQHVLRLLRGGPQIERRLQIQRLTARVFMGKESYAALDPAQLDAVLTPADNSRESYAANLLAFAHASESGQPAATYLNRVLEFVHMHPAMRQATWPFLYAAHYELTCGRGPGVARQWLSLLEDNGYNPFTLDFAQVALRLEATICLQEGRLAEAKSKAEESQMLLVRRLDHGSCRAEQQQIAALLHQTRRVTSGSKLPTPPRYPRKYAQSLFQAVANFAIIVMLCLFFLATSGAGGNLP